MNYIKHLTGFYDRIHSDDRLNPTHISLYLAMFQFWNLNHFRNPISISRSEMMRLSKIGALGTYHKCIRQLQEFGYIIYEPSFNPYKGSLVHLHNFDTEDVQKMNRKYIKKQTTSAQEEYGHHIKTKTGTVHALIPSTNKTNQINNKQMLSIPKINFEESESPSSAPSVILNEAKRNGESHSVKFNPPSISEIRMYFAEKDAPPEEAEKFFNHYESNGWLVGGKSKMKNWQAAARNWMLNSKKFNVKSVIPSTPRNLSSNHLTATTNKSYQDKL